MEYEYTIRQEMEHRGIESSHFRTFYCKLKETKQLPIHNIVPHAQYRSIVDYLKTNNVIGKNDEILEDGLKLFDNRKDDEHYREVNRVIKIMKDKQDLRDRFVNRTWRRF